MKQRAANRRHSASVSSAVQGRLASHLRCLVDALGRLHRRWLASLLTTIVIGITLALPAGLYVLAKNLNQLSYRWETSVQISMYLQQTIGAHNAHELAERIGARDGVREVRYISAEQGLESFRQASGLGEALDALPANPLPPVLVVTPAPDLSYARTTELRDELRQLSGVDRAELDQDWLRRLRAILAVFERSAWVIGLLLAGAVIFIVGNTIRLDIENRREEIEVMKLVGASDAFIRRPFLYTGFWYGLAGALLALLLLGLCFLALAEPLAALTRSYDGAFRLSGLGWSGCCSLLAIGIALGWSGCALTLNRRLRAIEPG